LILLLALAGGFVRSQTQAGDAAPAGLAGNWQASVSAENSKDYDAALTQITAWQQAGGNPFLANLRAGWLYYLKKDYAAATKAYTEAERLQPDAVNPLLGLLNVAQAQGKATAINQAVENVLHADPLNYTAQMAGAWQQFTAKNYGQSLAGYRRVLTYYPDDLDAISGEGWSLYYLGDLKGAGADFQILLSVNPSYSYAQQGFDLCAKALKSP
jgi:tetratricopeptide (TPR) repeat protein